MVFRRRRVDSKVVSRSNGEERGEDNERDSRRVVEEAPIMKLL